MEFGVARAVALEGGAGAVVAPAVELDGYGVPGPLRVDLVAVELLVHGRAREAVARAQVDERGLELAAGVRQLVGGELLDLFRPRSAGGHGQQ